MIQFFLSQSDLIYYMKWALSILNSYALYIQLKYLQCKSLFGSKSYCPVLLKIFKVAYHISSSQVQFTYKEKNYSLPTAQSAKYLILQINHSKIWQLHFIQFVHRKRTHAVTAQRARKFGL